MRLRPTSENPFGPNRYAYAWEALRTAGYGGNHIDYGSYDGTVAATLLRTGICRAAVAIDAVDAEENYHSRYGPAIPSALSFGFSKCPLPYEGGTFQTATALDVLEHIADQDLVLGELHRILAPNGILVITVPRRHIFSFLDTGNWKFRFPRLHQAYYVRRHSELEYADRYLESNSGLVGDIEIEKSWHEHFSASGLETLLHRNGFIVLHFDGSGLFARLLAVAGFLLPRATGLMDPIKKADAKAFARTHLFCTAMKRTAA